MDFNEIIGNQDVKNYLLNSIKQNNILHSYLFLGTSGIGKLLIAKEFAKKVLCLNKNTEDKACTCKSCTCFSGKNHPDFYLINESGENIKIDEIRELTEKVIEATNLLKEKEPSLVCDGELQLDAAIIPEVAASKNDY